MVGAPVLAVLMASDTSLAVTVAVPAVPKVTLKVADAGLLWVGCAGFAQGSSRGSGLSGHEQLQFRKPPREKPEEALRGATRKPIQLPIP